jgi:hypothetical protein
VTARPSTIPLYSLSDLSRYARAQTQLVHRLYLGHRDDEIGQPPVLRCSVDPREPAPYSFDDLIETAVVVALRSKGVSLQAIRAAHRVAKGDEPDHPFARRDIMIAGSEVFTCTSEKSTQGSEQLASLTAGGQRALEKVLGEYLHQIDWQGK